MVWLASNFDSKNLREALVRWLGAALPPTLPLHSVGRCLHNHDADECAARLQSDSFSSAAVYPDAMQFWPAKVAKALLDGHHLDVQLSAGR